MIKSVIFGCSGPELTEEERAFFQETQPLGFILFKRNVTDPKQLKALVDDLKSSVDHEYVPILIDQEGGKVNRLTPPKFEEIKKPAKYFGDIAKSNLAEAEELAFINYFKIGAELAKYGINVDCAPDSDLYYQDAHDVIGTRAFSEDVSTVVTLSNTAIKGLKAAGVEPVIKHLPGHGRANVDSHHELPRVDTSLEELENTDFAVFKQLTHAKWAMTAHIVYDCLDPDSPVTQSARAINYIRDQIGFKNIIITDDINMKALKGELDEITTKCYDAGCDIILQCSGKMADMQKTALALRDLPNKAYELMQPTLFFEMEERFEALVKEQRSGAMHG